MHTQYLVTNVIGVYHKEMKLAVHDKSFNRMETITYPYKPESLSKLIDDHNDYGGDIDIEIMKNYYKENMGKTIFFIFPGMTLNYSGNFIQDIHPPKCNETKNCQRFWKQSSIRTGLSLLMNLT